MRRRWLMSRWRQALAVAALGLAAGASGAVEPARQNPEPARQGLEPSRQKAEQLVRAQFVYNFANFVDWPANAFASPEAPLKICLFGQVSFAQALMVYQGVKIGARPLWIHPSQSLEGIREGCHILYLGDDQRVQLPSFWQEIRSLYVLRVGERDAFADQGGIINILRTQDRLQFEINLENALKQGLMLDSDLLSLARAIKRNGLASPEIRP